MLYFFMVAHSAACKTLLKAFLKSMKTWYRSCCWNIPSTSKTSLILTSLEKTKKSFGRKLNKRGLLRYKESFVFLSTDKLTEVLYDIWTLAPVSKEQNTTKDWRKFHVSGPTPKLRVYQESFPETPDVDPKTSGFFLSDMAEHFFKNCLASYPGSMLRFGLRLRKRYVFIFKSGQYPDLA